MKTPAHDHRFDVVWKGVWYRLGSLSDHHRHEVDPSGSMYLLLDSMSKWHTAPKSEVHIPCNPLP
jgi:hypothetical protein